MQREDTHHDPAFALHERLEVAHTPDGDGQSVGVGTLLQRLLEKGQVVGPSLGGRPRRDRATSPMRPSARKRSRQART
jgi:hypothetical protein